MSVTEGYTSRSTTGGDTSSSTATGSGSRSSVGGFGGLPALLAEFDVLLRASQFTGPDGGDWPNEGTYAADATANTLPADADALTQPAFFGPGDGLPAIRFYGPLVTETGESEMTAPHASATVPTTGFFVCGKGRAIRNAAGDPDYGGPGVAQFDWMLAKKGVLIDDDANLALGVRVSDGAIYVGWWGTDGDFDKHEHWLGSGVDVYEANEVAGSLVCDDGDGNHVVTVYVRDESGRDLTVNGRGWRIVDSVTVEGVTDIRNDSTLDWQAGDGKGWFSYAEWYDWPAATLALSCHPDEDATAWDGEADTFTTDGATWTLGANSLIVDASRKGFAGGPGGNSGTAEFLVAHNAAIDPSTGDFCWFVHGAWGPVSDADPSDFRNIMAKKTGTIGGGGSGVEAIDYGTTGGVGIAVATGGAPSLSGATWTPGEHLLVFNCHRDTDELDVWVDGIKVDTLDVSGFADLGTTDDLQVLPYLYAGFTVGAKNDSLTEDEITVTLPNELGA